MKKGELLTKSTGLPILTTIRLLILFFLTEALFLAYLIDLIINPTLPSYSNQAEGYYQIAHIIIILAALLGMLYLLRTTYWHTFSVYENGITLPYPALSNFLFFKNRKEGKFLPYEYILGYLGVEDFKGGEKEHKRWLKKGKE